MLSGGGHAFKMIPSGGSQALWRRSCPFIIGSMSQPARDLQPLQTASIDGLDEIFDVECQGELQVHAEDSEGVTGECQGETVGYTVAEAARRLGIPYTTFYKQVKAGKHETVSGPDGKPRVLIEDTERDSPGVSPGYAFSQGVTEGVSLSTEGVSEAYHLKIIEQLSAKLEGANYRIGWLESQLSEREKDVEELKLLTDSQHKPGLWARFKKWCAGG